MVKEAGAEEEVRCPCCGYDFDKLNEREIRMLSDVAEGLTYAQICQKRNLQPHTVRNYIRLALRKLNLSPGVGAHGKSNVFLLRYWNCELFQIGLKELGLL